MQKNINIQNKKARFQYEILDKYTAGIVLTGTEIKSIRSGKASITESFWRETIKDRDNKRNLDRIKKAYK